MSKLLRFIPGLLILCFVLYLFGSQFVSRPLEMLNILGEAKNAVSDPIAVGPTPIPRLSLTRIFEDDHAWVKYLPPEKTVTMIATGDVIPARSVNQKMVTGHGFRWPFEKTANVLSAADITVINLETPLLNNCPVTIEGMIFCGDARATDGLWYAGVDVATLGNNHIGNHGLEGVEETKRALDWAGIVPVGEGVGYKTSKGTRFAFLAYNDIGASESGVPWATEEGIGHDIREARSNADIVIVAFHWGEEYVSDPTERQKYLAHFSVNAGADIVLGNHPHWVQPVEIYRDKFISYAYGNFVFDQEWSEDTKRGVVGRYTFYEGKLIDVEFLPIRIVDYGQPYFLQQLERQAVLDVMRTASQEMVK